jgi:hypothetical protein
MLQGKVKNNKWNFIESRFLTGCKKKTKLINQSSQRKLIGQSSQKRPIGKKNS